MGMATSARAQKEAYLRRKGIKAALPRTWWPTTPGRHRHDGRALRCQAEDICLSYEGRTSTAGDGLGRHERSRESSGREDVEAEAEGCLLTDAPHPSAST